MSIHLNLIFVFGYKLFLLFFTLFSYMFFFVCSHICLIAEAAIQDICHMIAFTVDVLNGDMRADFLLALCESNYLTMVLLKMRYSATDNTFCRPVTIPSHMFMTYHITYHVYWTRAGFSVFFKTLALCQIIILMHIIYPPHFCYLRW